jgi:hypothetical protein
MLERAAVELAVRRRRESRREEWHEHIALAAWLNKYLDPACTFWTSLENKPISMLSGMFQKRRGVRSGLPDVMVLLRHAGGTLVIFIELKSHRGKVSRVQKQVRAEMLPTGAVWWMARSARRHDGAASLRRALPTQMETAEAQAVGRAVRRSDPALAAASGCDSRVVRGEAALSTAERTPRARGSSAGS